MTYNIIVTPINNLVVDENYDPVGLKDNQRVNHLTLDGQSQVLVMEYKSNFNNEKMAINVEEVEPAYHLIVSPDDDKMLYFIVNMSVKN